MAFPHRDSAAAPAAAPARAAGPVLAAIPWFLFPELALGPFRLQSFGILAAIGVLTALQLSAWAAARLGEDPRVVQDFGLPGLLGGLVGGHLVHLLFYHPEELVRPVRLLLFWEGLSSMGGLLGGIVAAAAYFRWKKVPFRPYSDAFALGVPAGWGIARLGCFTVHDHPGVLTDFPLAVAFPGGPRHDLGLYGAALLFTIAGIVWLLQRRGALRGRRLALVAVLYAPARFLLDFLRARDVVSGPDYFAVPDGRPLGLTFAQWFAIPLTVWGLASLLRRGGGQQARSRA